MLVFLLVFVCVWLLEFATDELGGTVVTDGLVLGVWFSGYKLVDEPFFVVVGCNGSGCVLDDAPLFDYGGCVLDDEPFLDSGGGVGLDDVPPII